MSPDLADHVGTTTDLSEAADWNTYSNPEDGFKVRYPVGAYLMEPGMVLPDIGGTNLDFADSSASIVAYNGVSLDIQADNNGVVGQIPCYDKGYFTTGSLAVFNGIDFDRFTDSRIENGNIAYYTDYCTVHNGIRYLIYMWISPITAGYYPDEAFSVNKFDQIMQDLQFAFIDSGPGKDESSVNGSDGKAGI